MTFHAHSSARRIGGGFTLVELLVVLAIIGLLVTVLSGVVMDGMVAGRQASSSSNLRQIGQALRMFAQHHNGDYPQTTHGNAHEKSWIYTMAPYLGDVDEVRICPADPQRRARKGTASSSYMLNEYIAVASHNPFTGTSEDFTNERSISAPAQTHATFVAADDIAIATSSDHTHSRGWTGGWSAVLADIQPDRFRRGDSNPGRTRGRSVYGFLDGHVEAIDGAELKRRHAENPAFARPPG